ncbi:MAG: putative efflux system [Paenibacillaceae bacterium]|jgi:multidrug efflux pump subunit AcrB|nr:putative efflux system [Paenibacillaceae bacterium]
MSRLTRFAMKNIAAMFILILILALGGTYAATSLKMESMPDISFPVVVVVTTYDAPPKDVAEDVTKPLEKALGGLEGLKSLTSTSSDNLSQIIVELESTYKAEDKKQDVEDLIANAKLPQSAERPKVMTFGFASEPVYYLAVYGKEGMSQAELDREIKDVIQPGFTSIAGFDHMDTVGSKEASLDIKLDADAINRYGLSPSQVSGAISSALTSSPAGAVDFNGSTQMVRVTGEMDTLYNLENMTISTPTGDTLQLKQIATVDAVNDSDYITRLSGKPAVALQLYKTKTGNIVEYADSVDKMIEKWKTTEPNLTFETVFNSAIYIKQSINGMVREGLLGALLASIMILFFLRNIRMTSIVLVSIPLSLLVALIIMDAMDITLNIMTLGGLAIAVGRVVDDSIVVIENIFSHLKKVQERGESVILYATKQVASAITSSTITTVGVFAPLGFVSGVVGEVFKPFAMTLVSALLASLLVALTVIPLLAKLLVLHSDSVQHEEITEGRIYTTYRKVLTWCLNHRLKAFGMAAGLFLAVMIGVAPLLPSAFMPESDSDRSMIFQVRLPDETSLESMDAQMKNIEQMMHEAKDDKGQPLFKFVETMIGYDLYGAPYPYKATMLTEITKDASPNKVLADFKARFLQELPKTSEVNAQLISFGGGGSGSDFSYSLKGDDALALKQGAKAIEEKLKEFPELTNVKDSLDDTKIEVEITVDQNKARLYGLSAGQVTQLVNGWIGKQDLGDRKFDNTTFATKVELDPTYKDNPQKIGQLQLRTATGSLIHLNEIASVKQIEAPSAIHREGQKQFVTITAKIESANKGGTSTKVSQALQSVELPGGISSEVKGVTEDIGNSFQQLFLAMGASIFIVYLVMVLAFGNASAPFAILFSLPLAAIGGILGLFITRQTIDVTSMIGFLMLIGIVVTNAIVLVDRVQQMREEGKSTREALIESGVSRMRPIVMTAGATILALLPLGVGMSEGTIISKGLAVVVIGGLITSTLLTLIIVPVVYEMNEANKARFARLFRRKARKSKGSPESPEVSNAVIPGSVD